MLRGRYRRRGEGGYIAIMVAILFSTIMIGLAAVGVDIARWYVEAERLQSAADSAALAGVVYLPDNLPEATRAARANAALNGYRHDDNAVVTVKIGQRRSQLDVVIQTDVRNQFGAAIGINSTTVSRHAVADYTSPAPMGSPCNAFGNEPPGGNNNVTGPGASGPRDTQIPQAYRDSGICSVQPNFWAAVEGPQTDKQNGDRYGTTPCTLNPTPYGCTGSVNGEATYPEGYFFAIKVPQAAVGKQIRLQLYDPSFISTGANCTSMPNSDGGNYLDNRNDYSSDPYDSYFRYTRPDRMPDPAYTAYARRFCTGDSTPLRATSAPSDRQYAPVTSFAVRSANDAQNPLQGEPVTGCTAQFAGQLNTPTLAELTRGDGSYRDAAAQVFHQWVSLCAFTPSRAGDFYLQVRTNVALPGNAAQHEYRGYSTFQNGQRVFVPQTQANRPTTYRYDDNPAVTAATGNHALGEGVNSFGVRAVSAAADQISVSGWSRMPMLQNVPNSTATFNLLRVLPSAAGQSISFEFFDVADGASAVGTVQVVPPLTAGGTQPASYENCQGALNDGAFARVDAGCSVRVASSTHNGQVQRMSIPIPANYSCKSTELTGCWFQVRITLNGDITDFTTWDASLQGDPVRLIE